MCLTINNVCSLLFFMVKVYTISLLLHFFFKNLCYKFLTILGNVDKPNNNNGGGLDAGVVAGIVIGVIVAIAAVLGLLYAFVVKPGIKQTAVHKSMQEQSVYDGGVENPNFAL